MRYGNEWKTYMNQNTIIVLKKGQKKYWFSKGSIISNQTRLSMLIICKGCKILTNKWTIGIFKMYLINYGLNC
jgi:hypothetical protein